MTKSTSKKAPGSAGRNAVRTPADRVVLEIEHLDALGVEALRELWTRRFRTPPVPPIRSADILRRLIAWKIQVEAFGDLDATTAATIARLMRPASGAARGSLPAQALRPGTVLIREWRGIEQGVLVLESGFEHRGHRYRTLTKVARAITGTRWSGPRFFGLEAKQLPKTMGAQP